MSSPPRLPRKPEARTEKVEDLVERVRRGQVRVPRFQRGLNWESVDVAQLFDSMYRGYPIGSLLFYKRPATAERLQVGALAVDAPESPEAWWVVDGQQRVTALAASLARSLPLPVRRSSKDPFAVYFDALGQRFEAPPETGGVPSEWVPLPQILDATLLSEWIFRWQHGPDETLRRIVFEAGARIREYPIPLYLIETDDDETVAKEIYYRVNKTGKPLDWVDVHKALFGRDESQPSTLTDLAEELAAVGMGRLQERRLLTCLVALRGLDPTRSLAEHRLRDPEVLKGAVQEALPVLRAVLSFLRQQAGIPHCQLLTKSILLDVLTRFFAVHTQPKPRTRALLARWFWRTVLGTGKYDDRTLRRRGIAAVNEDEEISAQRLLGLVRSDAVRPFELPESFDPRADASRLALLALAHLRPRNLLTGETIDVATLLENEGEGAFPRILERSDLELARSPANRLIQGTGEVFRQLRYRISVSEPADPVLLSHAIDAAAVAALADGDEPRFLERRAACLTQETHHFTERMAAWQHSDRPSVEHLLAEVEVAL